MTERSCDSASKRRCTKNNWMKQQGSRSCHWQHSKIHPYQAAKHAMVNPELGQRAARLSGWASATRWFCISYPDAKSDDSYWHHIDFWILLYTQFVYCGYDIFWWKLPLNTSYSREVTLVTRKNRSLSKFAELLAKIWGFLLSHLQKGQSGPIHCYFSCMVLGNDPWTRHGAKGFNAFW